MTSAPDVDVRQWLPDVLAGVVVLAIGLWELHNDLVVTSLFGETLVVVGVAVAVSLSRHAPGAALAPDPLGG